MNWIDGILISALIGGAIYGLMARNLVHLLVAFTACFFSLAIVTVFWWRFAAALGGMWALMLALVLLFFVPLVILYATGTLKKVERNFQWQLPEWADFYGSALIACAIAAVICVVIVMGMVVFAGMLATGTTGGMAASDLACAIVNSALARQAFSFLNWLYWLPGTILASLLGAGLISLAIRGRRINGGETVNAIEKETKILAEVTPYSSREYFERKAEKPTEVAPVAPTSTKEHFKRALDYKIQGEYDNAIMEYSKAIELDNNFALAYFNRGELLMLQGKKADAITDFQGVITLSESPELTRMAEKHIEELRE